MSKDRKNRAIDSIETLFEQLDELSSMDAVDGSGADFSVRVANFFNKKSLTTEAELHQLMQAAKIAVVNVESIKKLYRILENNANAVFENEALISQMTALYKACKSYNRTEAMQSDVDRVLLIKRNEDKELHQNIDQQERFVEYQQLIDEYIKHVHGANYSNQDKAEKLAIAYQAKAELTGEDIQPSDFSQANKIVKYSPNFTSNKKGQSFAERNIAFEKFINNSESKKTLGKRSNNIGKAILGKLYKAVRRGITGEKPLLKVGFFAKDANGKRKLATHGDALVAMVKRAGPAQIASN